MIIAHESRIQRDVARILSHVHAAPAQRTQPALLVLTGLPASGKSFVAAELRARTDAVILESDALRRVLFSEQTYSAAENRRLFAAVHAAIERLLQGGTSAIVDATNLTERQRQPLYDVAQRSHARLILAAVTAPDAVAHERLASRQGSSSGRPRAGRAVYDQMRERAERIERPHYVVDTAEDTGPVLAAIAKEMTEPCRE